jgi:hypothetical protein
MHRTRALTDVSFMTDLSASARADDMTVLSDAELEALLERLEREELTASRRRGSLHDRIEFVHAGGAASADPVNTQLATLQDNERQLSDRRLILHRQIDELRAERSRRLAASSGL